jgi:hypothetical protein
MLHRESIGSMAVAAVLLLTCGIAQAWDESIYPDFAGQWRKPRGGTISNQWDITKPGGRGQEAPLTPEYQAIFEASLADQAAGGPGNDPTYTCIPDGMPRAMNVIFPMEIVVTPKITYIMIEYLSMLRRIFTDGRDFPKDFERSFMGYSIGKWVDQDGNGRYDSLEVETRLLKGPRSFEPSGLPLHEDNETIVKERFYLNKTNPNILHDEITTIDHALTRPWTVTKMYNRERNPIFFEAVCAEGNQHVKVGKDHYMISPDGLLMPSKKGQPAPNPRYFTQSQK